MKRVLGLALVLCIAGAGCDKKEEASDPTPATPTTTASALDTSGTEQPTAAADDLDIPTEQDFEDEAETQITASNLESELDKLEKEIGE